MAPVLEDVALVLGPKARRRGVALTLAAQDAPDFRGDAEDLAEIAGALAENAVRWARRAVTISARRIGQTLLIEVADDGPGIAPEDRARLLARGARLDEKTEGHGLGLSIVADRVRAYGGALALDTAPAGGLSARVTLPAWG